MNITALGIDLAKKNFQLHGVDSKGKAILRKKLTREELPIYIAKLPPCLILMEACATSNYWGRKFKSMGHQVKPIAAQFVKPFVKSQKNDRNDAEAIVECGMRPTMRFVAIKESWQQDIQILHRARRRAVSAKTAIINQTKGLLLEYGIVIEEKSTKFKSAVANALEDAENELTSSIRLVIHENLNELDFLINQISIFEKEMESISRQSDDCKRLLGVPGVGLLGATAFIASVGDPSLFKNGRHVASWLGLVPKQYSTGGIPRLLSITKKGDPELRSILIHGARANLLAMKRKAKQDELTKWALNLLEKKGWGKHQWLLQIKWLE